MAFQLYPALHASLRERAADIFASDRNISSLSIWSHLYSLAYYHNFSTNWTLLRKNMLDYKRNWSGSCSLEITFQDLVYNSQKSVLGFLFQNIKLNILFILNNHQCLPPFFYVTSLHKKIKLPSTHLSGSLKHHSLFPPPWKGTMAGHENIDIMTECVFTFILPQIQVQPLWCSPV